MSKFAKIFIPVLVIAILSAPTSAQMSVTTIGASEAHQCYVNSANKYSGDTTPCDDALKRGNLTRVDEAKTRINRGVILNRNGDLNAAIADFNAALEINDTIGEAWLNRGNSWFMGGHLDEALADYTRALELNVSEPWAAWYNIGLVYDARGENDEARDAYEKALELNPDFTQAQVKLDRKN